MSHTRERLTRRLTTRFTTGMRGLAARLRAQDGASTAEYAITVLAACGFAAVLVALLKSGEVRSLLMGIITGALGLAGV